ncbi:MAG: acyltransferase [Oscillospiraceae bacterium]|nr:acyltransferase [Oscillospiraceae bacterium]
MAKQRDLGLDILRALAMFFVICLHILGQGGLVEQSADGSGKFYFLSFVQILVYCAVDIYGITTGYLLCRKQFRLARLTKLWLTTVFWSVVVSCCFFALVPESRTISEMISMFLPILRGRYWFFTAYFVVILVSPVLNLVIAQLSRRQFHLLFAALFVIFGVVPVCSLGYDVLRISGGSHFSWMIVLYLIGGYLRKNDRQGGRMAKEPRSSGWQSTSHLHWCSFCTNSSWEPLGLVGGRTCC